jgi:hypothetical protein
MSIKKNVKKARYDNESQNIRKGYEDKNKLSADKDELAHLYQQHRLLCEELDTLSRMVAIYIRDGNYIFAGEFIFRMGCITKRMEEEFGKPMSQLTNNLMYTMKSPFRY